MTDRLSIKSIISDRPRSQLDGIRSDIDAVSGVVKALKAVIEKDSEQPKTNVRGRARSNSAAVRKSIAIDSMIADSITEISDTIDGFIVFKNDYCVFLDRCLEKVYRDDASKR